MTIAAGEFANADSRLRQLLDSSLSDADDRALPHILRETADTARVILGCKYAAISVLGPDGQLEHFIASGADDDTVERVGRLPAHEGLLGAVVNEAITVRIPDIGTDPRSAGLPEHHPPIRSLLGVPIMLRGRSGGGLYLSEPNDADEFTDTDERAAELIAGAAANIIEKSRTADQNRRRERWYTGAAELAKELVSDDHVSPLRLIVERVAEIADADLVSIIQRGPSEDTLVVSAAAGASALKWDGYLLPAAQSLTSRVMHTGKPMNIADVGETSMLPAAIRDEIDVERVALIPLIGTDVRGVLCIGRAPGRPMFSAAELGMAMMFAGQVTLALELAESQARRDRLALVEERDRIARDLHDHVIQRLYAVGLTMQSAGMAVSGIPAERLQASVDEIDETIKQIRSTIYRLTVPIVSSQVSIRAQAARLLDDLGLVLGFRPQLSVEGPVDFGVGEDVIDDCVAVLREALTNVARHAAATRAEVAIAVTSDCLQLEVRDNGRGMGEVSRRSGLANLRARAERRNGSLDVRSSRSQGTRLRWSIPIEGAESTSVTAG